MISGRRLEPLIRELDPPKPAGRKRQNPRKMLNAILFRMRSGCQWNRLPSYLGDDSTVHRTFQRWASAGVLPRIRAAIQCRCEELGWTGNGSLPTPRWARPVWGGCNRSPSDRPGQTGNQAQSCRRQGGPLGIVVAGANVHDTKLLAATLDAVVVERRRPTEPSPQHLCLDKAYDNPTGAETVARHD